MKYYGFMSIRDLPQQDKAVENLENLISESKHI